jgi:periplasmic divalent cation tolerance protein
MREAGGDAAAIRIVLFVTTTADRGVADRIARGAIERRLGACARIVPADSVYRWRGEICASAEFVVEIKTSRARLSALENMVLELHDYDLPEIVVVPVVAGSAAYLDWLSDELADASLK